MLFKSLTSLLLLVPALATYQCPHGKPQRGGENDNSLLKGELPWTSNSELKQSFVKDEPAPFITPERVSVDLDLPPYERWLDIGKKYASQSDLIIQYFEELLPKPLVKIIDKVAAHLVTYKGFGDFGEEMRGYADGLGLDIGYVVAANLVYEMEHIGVTCDNWNNTGPTGQCDGEDPNEIVYLMSEHYKKTQDSPVKSGGYCTSVVANSLTSEGDDKIVHGRNLDWNLDVSMRSLIVTVDYHRSGVPLYSGSSIISFVGLLNALKPSTPTSKGFAFSMNARCQGGKLLLNLLEAIKFGAETPEQHARVVMESAVDYADAVSKFESGKLINDVYYIVSGDEHGEGAVISRSRNHNADTWAIDASEEGGQGWYRLQTNYDHMYPDPDADNRRDPGEANMNAVGADAINEDNIIDDVMTIWPTFNPHTDLTCVMVAKEGLYDCKVWMDE